MMLNIDNHRNFNTSNNSIGIIRTMMNKMITMIAFVIVVLTTSMTPGCYACYFPIEYQGTFLIQTQGLMFNQPIPSQSLLDMANDRNGSTSISTQVTYSEVTIEADAIPPWGRCHKRRGNNVILKDTTGSGQDCMRCFHLSMKTPNIISLHTDGLERCYTNEEAARATCPLDKDIQQRKKFKEIILFRKHIPGGLQSIEHVFCPFNGRFRFTYTGNNGKLRCDSGYSEMSNCPHGNALNVKFRKCSFNTMDIHFLCLGDWEASNSNNNERYLALMDLRESLETNRPKYRCGLYKEDHLSGQITVSLSSDSTCSTNLSNSTSGFETLTLQPIPQKRIPPIAEASKYRFPDWMQGRWQRSRVEMQQFIYRDEQNQFRTIRFRCIMRQNDIVNDRFVVHSTTQCGEQSYTCLWVKRRSSNIMEFKLSEISSPVMSEKLCDERNFANSQWITEGKEKIVAQSTPCPITGDYTGEVPGASGLCAKVASDCNNPDIMFYSVSSCENRSHVYEEREYRCLGNWEEDGILYTFTQRRDMPGHQCFAGKIYRNGDEAYIKEAGESCMRGEDEDPLIFGMKIIKQASCPRHIVPKPIIIQSSSTSSIHNQLSNQQQQQQQQQQQSQQQHGRHHLQILPAHHQTKFSYPPIIRPLMPTLSPSPSPSIIFHHSSFKPIHIDRQPEINNNQLNGQINKNHLVNSNRNNPFSFDGSESSLNQISHQPIYPVPPPPPPPPPFWSYESADLQPASKTLYKPIISDRDKNNRRYHSSASSTINLSINLSLSIFIFNVIVRFFFHH
ncbi:hypothetical protein SSS_06808 [Sarcoptes scabiei]|uniref:Uncharacterized protein n=1 Tax=Sarcoptes scabiei TaxID=52283 RepID=A0A834R6A6_SARSC|nr:hypothetical protein SSS_06808 [Sarcoptes scabiei]